MPDLKLPQNPEAEWFGARRVAPQQKTDLVRQVFSSVAASYDVMNDVMSGGLHRVWKDILVQRIQLRPNMQCLDVAGGTGDIALRLHSKLRQQKCTNSEITICDINPDMLAVGRAKALDRGILKGMNWVTGNAEELPFADNSRQLYTIAFGLRNVTRIDQALREAARVVQPGGRFYCLEFSPGVIDPLKKIYDAYCGAALPLFGQFIAKDRDAYQYLAESILQFPPQQRLAERIERAGFSQCRWTNLSGGIAVIHEAWRI